VGGLGSWLLVAGATACSPACWRRWCWVAIRYRVLAWPSDRSAAPPDADGRRSLWPIPKATSRGQRVLRRTRRRFPVARTPRRRLRWPV